jgi:hypothetical protein
MAAQDQADPRNFEGRYEMYLLLFSKLMHIGLMFFDAFFGVGWLLKNGLVLSRDAQRGCR